MDSELTSVSYYFYEPLLTSEQYASVELCDTHNYCNEIVTIGCGNNCKTIPSNTYSIQQYVHQYVFDKFGRQSLMYSGYTTKSVVSIGQIHTYVLPNIATK